ncbi:SDR family NAD(P)-dependent oxidoreductase [Novosphingobium sp. M1R2S20]|uniref:SDR family NAD(P)-dependent oxidoreductase n=1 Tax=Novosphingobium rhizovicinum TaxID=3228928 RepID=A0ABV3RCC5_9SPHN
MTFAAMIGHMKDREVPQRILITGASGGLGSALARFYARPGVSLSLWGRDVPRLTDVAQACRAAGALVDVRSLDLSDVAGAVDSLNAEDNAHSVDLALFVSGLGDIRPPADKVEGADLVARLGVVNYVAPTALAAALAARMAERGQGRIVLIGSAAAFHALPFAAAYSGSKAGLARFAEALRLGVREHGVAVTLVSPGFIDTAAGRRVPGPKPLLRSPQKVAEAIARAAERRQAHVVLPWPFKILRLFDRLLPRALRERVLLGLSPPSR